MANMLSEPKKTFEVEFYVFEFFPLFSLLNNFFVFKHEIGIKLIE